MRLPVTLLIVALMASLSNAATIVYVADLSGTAVFPPNASPAVGKVTVTIDDVLDTMRVQATFSGLQGVVTAAHIHAATLTPFTGTAGVATQTPTFAGFPSGVTFGSYDRTFDMTLSTSYRSAYIADNGGTPATAFSALIGALDSQRAYFDVHTTAFPGGEVRGFFVVPEPASLTLLAGAGVVMLRRRR